jgi:hypothetical protein
MKELLIGELTPTHEQDGKAKRKGKVNINLPPPKMKPFWKMKKWFKLRMI